MIWAYFNIPNTAAQWSGVLNILSKADTLQFSTDVWLKKNENTDDAFIKCLLIKFILLNHMYCVFVMKEQYILPL